MSNSNKQCSAMAIMSLLYSIKVNCSEWSSSVIDTILIKGSLSLLLKYILFVLYSYVGDIYYSHCCGRIIDNKNSHLSVEDVVGCICLDEIFYDVSWIYYPNLSKSINQIIERIEEFVETNKKHALIVTGIFCFGLINEDGNLYFFDSHSRSPQGKYALNGKACIIKFSNEDKIKYLVNHLCKFLNNNNITLEISDIVCTPQINHNEVVLLDKTLAENNIDFFNSSMDTNQNNSFHNNQHDLIEDNSVNFILLILKLEY